MSERSRSKRPRSEKNHASSAETNKSQRSSATETDEQSHNHTRQAQDLSLVNSQLRKELKKSEKIATRKTKLYHEILGKYTSTIQRNNKLRDAYERNKNDTKRLNSRIKELEDVVKNLENENSQLQAQHQQAATLVNDNSDAVTVNKTDGSKFITFKNIQNIKEQATTEVHKDHSINDILIMTINNEKVVASAGSDGSIKFTRLRDMQIIKTIEKAHANSIESLALTKGKNTDVLVSCSSDGTIKSLDINRNFKEIAETQVSNNEDRFFKHHYKILTPYEYNGRHMLACAMDYGRIDLWDLEDWYEGKAIPIEIGGKANIRQMKVFRHKDELYLLSAGDDLKMWSLSNDIKHRPLIHHRGAGGFFSVRTFDFDGYTMVAAAGENEVVVWRFGKLESKPEYNIKPEKKQLKKKKDKYEIQMLLKVGNDINIRAIEPAIHGERMMLAMFGQKGLMRCFDMIMNKSNLIHEDQLNAAFNCTKFDYDDNGDEILVVGGTYGSISLFSL